MSTPLQRLKSYFVDLHRLYKAEDYDALGEKMESSREIGRLARMIGDADEHLTDKRRPDSRYDSDAREALEAGNPVVHLSDGGYSRLTLSLTAPPHLWLDKGVSTQKVVERWEKARIASVCRRAARPIRLDKAAIRRVRDGLVRKFERWVERNRFHTEKLGVETRKPLATATMEVKDVAGVEHTTEIYLFSKKSGVPLWIVGAGAGTNRRSGNPTVVVFLNAKYTVDGFLNKHSTFHDHLLTTLQHEITHVADTFAKPPEYEGGTKKMVEGDPEMDWDAYYNDPQEVRAFMRELADKVRGGFPKFLDAFGPHKGLEYALKTSDWPEIKQHLTPRNRKLMLKGIYTHLQDEGLIP